MHALKKLIYFRNLLELPILFLVFLWNTSKQKRFLRQTISETILESKIHNDNSLDEYDYRKILLYGYAVQAMLGEAYCVLRGQKMTSQERLSITYLAAITGLFDDLFDKKEYSEEYIKKMIMNSESAIGKNSNERLLIEFYNKSLENSENSEKIKEYAFHVFDAQISSRKQKNPDTDLSEIEKITYLKGGVSMLLYRSTLNNKMETAEESMIFKLGSIGQLENDIFDVYKDYKEGIRTLVTTMQKTNTVREKYLKLMSEVFNLVEQTNFKSLSKKKFRLIISLIMSRGLVCLDCIEKNEKKTNYQFCIDRYERKNLICNMESFRSFAKLIHYSAKYNI